jgi:hypothetical protein
MRPFRVPQVFLRVLTCDLTLISDESGNVREIISMFLDNGTGDDAYFEFFCESAVGV